MIPGFNSDNLDNYMNVEGFKNLERLLQDK